MPDPTPDLVFFGDSLSDDGNLFDFSEGLLPDDIREALVGPKNAVSNGPTHATYTADISGLTSFNYAVAAAEAAGTQTLRELVVEADLTGELLVPLSDPALDLDINLNAQVDRFLADFGTEDLSETQVMLLIGGNDIAGIDLDSPNPLQNAMNVVNDVVDSVVANMHRLFLADVEEVTLFTLPYASFFAATSDVSAGEEALANLFVGYFNNQLQSAASELSVQGHDVDIYDFNGVTTALFQDPVGFGLVAPYDDTLTESDVLDDFDPDQVAFYSDVHPSAATHGVLGAASAFRLNGGDVILQQSLDGPLAFSGNSRELVFAGRGRADVNSGGGDDVLFGGLGRDELRGQKGDDILSGGSGADQLFGAKGSDILDGDDGNDRLLAGKGADVLIDGLGSDFAYGGGGADTFIFTQASLIGGTDGTDTDMFRGGGGIDSLYLVLDEFTAALLETDLEGAAPQAALASLGISASGIEIIEVLAGRSALLALNGETWFAEADVWGLV